MITVRCLELMGKFLWQLLPTTMTLHSFDNGYEVHSSSDGKHLIQLFHYSCQSSVQWGPVIQL